MPTALKGQRHEIAITEPNYPELLARIDNPPETVYAIGNTDVLGMDSIAVIGARKATPYGRGCATRFTKLAGERGFAVVSGGARGIDGEAHRAALEVGAPTITVLAGGLDHPYPHEHADLFQKIIISGGCIISEQPWDMQPRPYMFRNRNRITAGLAHATLVVEAGFPSGTFSCAEYAFDAGREVWTIPGAITAINSRGTNQLLLSGAKPIIDDASFIDALERMKTE